MCRLNWLCNSDYGTEYFYQVQNSAFLRELYKCQVRPDSLAVCHSTLLHGTAVNGPQDWATPV